MAVFLLHGNATRAEQQPIRDALKKSIPELADVDSLTAMLESAAKTKRDERSVGIALLPLEGDLTFDQLVQFVNQQRDEIFLILIGGELSASAYKRLIRSGAADWTSAKSDLNEVLDIIARRRYTDDTDSRLQRGVGHRPVTISFIPSAGGVGNTTLAIEAAAYIKSEGPHDIEISASSISIFRQATFAITLIANRVCKLQSCRAPRNASTSICSNRLEPATAAD